ncbi:zymogen granule membrane protein 16-like [Brachionichthys hirsutus]|uniref:zymogen granule membrane protein 16-like n=1 Tax=Brachionichthys hirsutus TaxID=412623 RepID=UPI003604ECD3
MTSKSKMFSYLVFTMLFAGCLSYPNFNHYTYSDAIGSGSGKSFQTNGYGRITGIRIWELSHSIVTGFQLCFHGIWDEVIGRKTSIENTLLLFEDEFINQVSGKYFSTWIYQLRFGTSRGRFLFAGQPLKISFNMYPDEDHQELIKLSGFQSSDRITALAAHWMVPIKCPSNNTHGGIL